LIVNFFYIEFAGSDLKREEMEQLILRLLLERVLVNIAVLILKIETKIDLKNKLPFARQDKTTSVIFF
jgi:hypothetical protein